MSGYTADIIADRGAPGGGARYIQKPFSLAEFAAALPRAGVESAGGLTALRDPTTGPRGGTKMSRLRFATLALLLLSAGVSVTARADQPADAGARAQQRPDPAAIIAASARPRATGAHGPGTWRGAAWTILPSGRSTR